MTFATQNRRLRHLQGITIRNIAFTEGRRRPRSQSIDDEAIPGSLRSPAKAVVQRELESLKLEHSRSSTDLRSISESLAVQSDGAVETDEAPARKSVVTTPKRPAALKLRRRSTMEWANASPQTRQQKLEDVTAYRMADAFFSLHIAGIEGPVYISEVAGKTMNPSFRFFNLLDCGPYVTRLSEFTIKVWAKTEKMEEYKYLLEMIVDLQNLQFVGKTLDGFRRPLPANCVLFHLEDGIYTSFAESRHGAPPTMAIGASKMSSNRILSTSTYDSLMRLSNLDECIQDALQTREKLSQQICDVLAEHQESIKTIREVGEAKEALHAAQNAVATQKKRVENACKRRDQLKARMQARREYMAAGRTDQLEGEAEMDRQRSTTIDQQVLLEATSENISGQRRRICEDLLGIFPIEAVPNKSLQFTIRSLHLPNSAFDAQNIDEDAVAAALGYVAQIVEHLSYYFSVPLPYPITPRCSTSSVADPISTTPNSALPSSIAVSSSPAGVQRRTYPLFMRSAPRFRFEYAVFLLNKDLEILANHLQLRVMDLRQTLPNLKYLLYVATAGKGELPARKAGGIRGLLRGGVGGSGLVSPALSRTASIDSNASSMLGDAAAALKKVAASTAVSGAAGKKPAAFATNGRGGISAKADAVPAAMSLDIPGSANGRMISPVGSWKNDVGGSKSPLKTSRLRDVS